MTKMGGDYLKKLGPAANCYRGLSLAVTFFTQNVD